MFKSKATTSSTPPDGSCCSSGPPQLNVSTNPTWAQLMQPRGLHLSPDNMHHPAHTSPHVHKTKLYSPYSTSGHNTPRHGAKRREGSPAGHRVGGWASSSTAPRPPPPKLRPISDMNKLLGAVFKEDGSVAETIPRSALGLPGIKTFDAMAENGGVKIESMDIDVDLPIQFPTHEDVVIGACTCGEDCECSGCATHGIPPRTGTGDDHVHDGGCGDNCKSSFDCADHLSLPSGITSIGHLLSLAAANVPPPAQKRPVDLSGHAHDTRILPAAAHHSEDAARSLGLVTLKPLECCNGRCQCAPGQCVCEKECCGCCLRCACDEDGDSKMNGTRPHVAASTASSCCSTRPDSQAQSTHSSSGSTGTVIRHPSPANSRTATPPLNSPMTASSHHSGSPPLLSPETVNRPSRQPSPNPSAKHSSASTLRRASSTVAQSSAGSATIARRATVTHGSGAHRTASTGKQASKALALHTNPNHPHSNSHSTHTIHPRPILPKPPSHGSQSNGSKNVQGSRIATPNQSAQATAPSSAQTSKHSSPAVTPTTVDAPQPQYPLQLPEALVRNFGATQMSDFSDLGMSQNRSLGPLGPQGSTLAPQVQDQFGPQQPTSQSSFEAFGDFASEADLMAFINQITAQSDSRDMPASAPPSSTEGSLDLPLITPDRSVDEHSFEDSNARRSNGGSGVLSNDLSSIDSSLLSMFESVINTDSLQQSDPSMSDPASLPQQTYSPLPHSTAYARYQMFADQYTPSLPTNANRSASMNLGSRLDVYSPVDGGFALSLSELLAGRQQDSASLPSQASKPEPVYRQLPPDLQRALGQNPALSSGRDIPSSQPSASPSHTPGSSNLIDLSKPLNASDVERILRALQEQQARSSPSGSAAPGESVSSQTSAANPGLGNAMGSVSIPAPNPPSIPQSHSQASQQPEGQIFDVNFNPFTMDEDVLETYLRNNPGFASGPPDLVSPQELDIGANGFQSLQGDMNWNGGDVVRGSEQNSFAFGLATQSSGG